MVELEDPVPIRFVGLVGTNNWVLADIQVRRAEAFVFSLTVALRSSRYFSGGFLLRVRGSRFERGTMAERNRWDLVNRSKVWYWGDRWWRGHGIRVRPC